MTYEEKEAYQQGVIRDFDKEARPLKITDPTTFIRVPDCLDKDGNMLHMTLEEYLQYRVKKDFKE